MDRRSFLIGAGSCAPPAPALAQDNFPSHAITIINAFPPGGINDIVTRPLAAALEPMFNQPVVVETKAGAAGQVGAQVAANAKPDGYTLLSHNTGISGYAEVDKLFGRPVKTSRADFIPLARLIADPVLLLVNDQQPYKTLKEFIDAAKAKPDTLVFSSGGLYGASHLPMALLSIAAGGLEGAPPADQRRRPGHHRDPRQQCAGDHPIGLGDAAAHQGRQAARARVVRRQALAAVARRADVEGARLRRRILSLGRDFRAEGDAGSRSCRGCAPASSRRRTASSSWPSSPMSARSSPISTARTSPKFWDDDGKRVDETVKAIGRV